MVHNILFSASYIAFKPLNDSISWLTVSNALENSRKSPKAYSPLSNNLSTRYSVVSSGECSIWNPNWNSCNKLHLLVKNDGEYSYEIFLLFKHIGKIMVFDCKEWWGLLLKQWNDFC